MNIVTVCGQTVDGCSFSSVTEVNYCAANYFGMVKFLEH